MIVFLIWLYTWWLIFLVGAEITYFHQYPSAFIREALTGARGYRFQEWLALSALVEIEEPKNENGDGQNPRPEPLSG